MANRRLSQEIRAIHHEVNGIYDHRRIKAELSAMGHACGRHRGSRLMREAGLRVRSRKRWRLVSSSRHDLPIAPNHMDRRLASDRANRHWVSDMTYVRTAQGWLYLAVVLDLYSRAVVGWRPDTLRQLPEAKTDLFDTITAVATRCWAVSVRWSMSGEIRAVALNYLSTGSGTDHNLQSAPLSGIIHSTHKREFAWIMSSVFFTRA